MPSTSSSPEQTAATIERWRAEEAALGSRAREPGVIDAARLAAKPGIALFEAMLAGELPPPPISRTLDFTLISAEPGHVVFQGKPGHAQYNPLGTVHGGWFATLLDSALACAVHSALPAGRLYTTVELKINIVKALTEKVPLVRAAGHVVHLGRSMGTAEGRLTGPDGALYAHASTTCFIFEAKT
jgi:uncharacterized protein (TIGR00369 family)